LRGAVAQNTDFSPGTGFRMVPFERGIGFWIEDVQECGAELAVSSEIARLDPLLKIGGGDVRFFVGNGGSPELV